MKKNILIISPFVPYDKVAHAGGKSHNYYVKRLNQDDEFSIKLVTFGKISDKNKIDLDKYNVDYQVSFYPEDNFRIKISRLYNKLNIFSKHQGMYTSFFKKQIKYKLEELKKNGYYPDIIFLEWTQTTLLSKMIRSIFNKSYIISIEHDVTYLSFKRRFDNEKFLIKKLFKLIKYKRIYKSEIKSLEQCDLVLTLNIKDYLLLKKPKVTIKRLDFISPYYMNLNDVKPDFSSKNIVFFGKMDRYENYQSCIWFIDNVFNELVKIDKEFKFYIVGYNPNKKLKKYESKNVIITGYVDDVKKYFENSLCFVAPLVLGAGIKIKILEAMSAGSIILTNDIGIEGIPAEDRKQYFHCENSKEYLQTILDISSGKYDLNKISNSARNNLKLNFSTDNSFIKLKRIMNEEVI